MSSPFRIRRSLVVPLLILAGFWLLFISGINAEPYILQKVTPVFNPKDPAQQVGQLFEGAKLEIDRTSVTNGMVTAEYRKADGKVVKLLCSVEDVPVVPAKEPAKPLITLPNSLKMALVNMKCLYSDGADARKNIQTNLDRHMYFVDQLAPKGVEFIGFPEMSVSGYHFSSGLVWLKLDGPEVKALGQKAVQKKIYISAGIAEIDSSGKKWNTQFVVGPKGDVVGWHHKNWLTAEKGHTESGTDHNVFEVKGIKMGISTCADGSNFDNLKALADNGAQIIYGPHANTTGGTVDGWYTFRGKWGSAEGWIAKLKVYAGLHNHAGLFNPDYNPPVANDTNNGFASGAWFIGPDGDSLSSMPSSNNPNDSKEHILIQDLPPSNPAPPAGR